MNSKPNLSASGELKSIDVATVLENMYDDNSFVDFIGINRLQGSYMLLESIRDEIISRSVSPVIAGIKIDQVVAKLVISTLVTSIPAVYEFLIGSG